LTFFPTTNGSGATEGAPHVLLVGPRVEDAERQQVADRPRTGRRPRLGVEVVLGHGAQGRNALAGDVAELVEDIVAGS
jgi:hypothetical protein